MTAQPAEPAAVPDTGSYEVIRLGGQAAVVVLVADFLWLRALEQAATAQELEDVEDTAAVLAWKARDAAGQPVFVPADEARAGWACPDEPADRLRREGDRSAGRVSPRRSRRRPRGARRDRPAGRRSRPAGSFRYGSPDLRRMPVGRYRVLYELTGTRWRCGTSPAGPPGADPAAPSAGCP